MLITSLASAFVLVGILESETPQPDEWSRLDSDIELLLETARSSQEEGLSLEGFLRASYINSGDVTVAGNDLSGFSLDNARIIATGNVDDFGVVFEFEGSNDSMNPNLGLGGAFTTGVFGGTGAGSSLTLLDAYGEWYLNDQFTLTFGQFRPWTFHDVQLDPIDQMFIDRSFNSEWWAFRDQGVMIAGVHDRLNWYAGLQNGRDNVGDDLAIFGRVDYAVVGDVRDDSASGVGVNAEANNLNVGVGYYDDDNLGGEFVSADGEWQGSNVTVVAEVGLYGDDYFGGAFSDLTVWSIAGAYMLQPDKWEVALRYEDLDELAQEAEIYTAGVNYYLGGHDRKVQLNVSQLDRDQDVTVVQLGMAMGF